jgi:hypothetical protein
MNGFPANVVISGNDWPPECRAPHPGDLSQFMPQGIGMSMPLVVMPWGAVRQDYYGLHEPSAHPFLNAPPTAPTGGTFYFSTYAKQDQLMAALALIGVNDSHDYAAYAASSADPRSDRYLDQMRFVSFTALDFRFGADNSAARPQQTLTVRQAAWAFIEAQRSKWDDGALAGSAGGDGDNYEALAFGFHVENSYNRVYRIWSRPWIVTK